MPIDTLSLPYDITWQRLAWTRDMLDRSYAVTLPPKWRSSAAVYVYPVPLADTTEDYPDHRIVYLKVTASITGWSPSETLQGHILGNESWDSWQTEGWQVISQWPTLTKTYWPCVGAILQLGVYPRPETEVDDEDYPYIIDFEPKKRELYESVSDTEESLSASQGNLNVRKGGTTTKATEFGGGASFEVPGLSFNASTRTTKTAEEVDFTTTDASTERRETAGRATQLSQMYQLFNGYHLGTNRAVFAMFPRPHIVSKSDQVEQALINGERKLEGIQDVFLIVQVPRTIPGICVRLFLDTAHKGYPENNVPAQVVVTRRTIGGCGEFDDDRLSPVPPPVDPPRMQVVGEHEVGGWNQTYKSTVKGSRPARITIANELNQAMGEVQESLLADAATGTVEPFDFVEGTVFRRLAGVALRSSTRPLSGLVALGYLNSTEQSELSSYGILTVGQLFSAYGTIPAAMAPVRERLLDALATAPLPP